MSERASVEELNAILRLQETREAEHREKTREAVASAPVPLTTELMQAVLRLSGEHMGTIVREHAGFELAERRESYRTSLAIWELSASDLLAAIDDFAARALAEGSTLFQRHEGQALEAIERRIQKELFATADAAASLVDHSRRMLKLLDLPTHGDQLRRCFGTDGLHEFVIALRVLLHHLHMVEAGWNLQRSFSEGTGKATFAVSRKTLLRVIPQHEISKRDLVLAYVASQPGSIDLKEVFEEYRTRARQFHGWFSDQLAADSLVALRDYDRIMQEKKNLGRRMWWNALLGNWLRNWKTPPNPHDHLHKYLTEVQLAEVYALPRNSKEQVDLVIRYVDPDNAIDDDLRTLAYELFERFPPPIANSTPRRAAAWRKAVVAICARDRHRKAKTPFPHFNRRAASCGRQTLPSGRIEPGPAQPDAPVIVKCASLIARHFIANSYYPTQPRLPFLTGVTAFSRMATYTQKAPPGGPGGASWGRRPTRRSSACGCATR